MAYTYIYGDGECLIEKKNIKGNSLCHFVLICSILYVFFFFFFFFSFSSVCVCMSINILNIGEANFVLLICVFLMNIFVTDVLLFVQEIAIGSYIYGVKRVFQFFMLQFV